MLDARDKDKVVLSIVMHLRDEGVEVTPSFVRFVVNEVLEKTNSTFSSASVTEWIHTRG